MHHLAGLFSSTVFQIHEWEVDAGNREKEETMPDIKEGEFLQDVLTLYFLSSPRSIKIKEKSNIISK